MLGVPDDPLPDESAVPLGVVEQAAINATIKTDNKIL
jgi:hypothetical protein